MLLLPFGFLNVSGDTPIPDATLALSPYAYWRMSSAGSTETDIINGHVGTYYGSPTLQEAGRDINTSSAKFGINKGLTIPDNPNFTPANGSVCGWVKMESTAVSGAIVTKYEGTNRSWSIATDTGSHLFVTVSSLLNPFSGWQGFSGAYFIPGVWQHFAVTFGSSGTKLYMNGRLCLPLNTNAGTNAAITVADNVTSLRIGNNADNTDGDINGTTIGFKGWMSDVALFTRILSESEIQTIIDEYVSLTAAAYNPLTDLPGLTGWFDPQDASTVFSDTAGTTPQLVDGGSVASIKNLADGSIWSQSNAGYRPILHSSGASAPRSVRFSAAQRIDSPGTVPITRFMAVAYKTATVGVRHVIFGQYPNGNDTNFEINGANQLRHYYNAGDRGNSQSAHANSSKVTVSAYHQASPAQSRIFLNGAGDKDVTSITGGSATVMYIGSDIRDPNPALAIPFNGYLCGALFSSSTISLAQAIAAQHYLMRKCQGYL